MEISSGGASRQHPRHPRLCSYICSYFIDWSTTQNLVFIAKSACNGEGGSHCSPTAQNQQVTKCIGLRCVTHGAVTTFLPAATKPDEESRDHDEEDRDQQAPPIPLLPCHHDEED
jgi:hypothetical protein